MRPKSQLPIASSVKISTSDKIWWVPIAPRQEEVETTGVFKTKEIKEFFRKRLSAAEDFYRSACGSVCIKEK